jgi:hypothetical protein
MSAGWIALAIALELASGAHLPGGGVDAHAVGGWLLHRAGSSTRRILKRSSGLFFLTSATNVAAIASAGALLAAGVGHGHAGFLRAVVPIIAAVAAIAVVLALPLLASRRRITAGWVRDLICGVQVAERALVGGSWRLLGAIAYLGFDIAALGVTIAPTGHPCHCPRWSSPTSSATLANPLPIPGGIAVLEGGLAGMLILYSARPPGLRRRRSSITRSRPGSPAPAVSPPTGGCGAGCGRSARSEATRGAPLPATPRDAAVRGAVRPAPARPACGFRQPPLRSSSRC